MARLAVGAIFGLVVGIVAGAALGLHAQTEPDDETVTLANDVGVEPIDLLGASNTTGLAPRAYLISVGLLAQPPSSVVPAGTGAAPAGTPIGGPLGQRIFCIEGIESRHGQAMYNPIPVGGQHAQGWLGFLPSTARSVGVTIGNRWSEWQGAAYMLAHGRGREFFGVAAGFC